MEDQIWNGIIKRLTGIETENSKTQLDQWLAANEEHKTLYEEVLQLWQLTGLIPTQKADMTSEEQAKWSVKKNKLIPFKRWLSYGVAASLVLGLFSFYYLTKSPALRTEEVTAYTVHKANNGRMLKVVLPDSSVVWLNAGSQLSYPKKLLSQSKRTVRLVGEAFFEVTHNQKQPFVVESGNLKTVVYGTSFNVSSYQNSQSSSVTVKTGKVGVLLKTDTSNKPTMLLPGNGLVYHHRNGKLEAVKIPATEVAAWLKGELVFEQAAPQEVFAALERKFDVEVRFDPADFKGCKLTAKFPNQSLKTILTVLHTSLNLKVKEEGRIITIKGGTPCK